MPVTDTWLRSGQPALQAGLVPYPGYRLRTFLGRGGFGEVWEAAVEGGAPVALKFMECNASRSAQHEIRTLQVVQHLSHPNLLRVERVWSYQSFLVIAMELAHADLDDLLQAAQKKHGTGLGLKQTCAYLTPVADALDFLNRRQHKVGGQLVGVQHCDVKPSNMLLVGGTVKLGDFGTATLMTAGTQPHRHQGTADYAAPELFQRRVHERTDQYALAVSYCVVRGGGRLPFADAAAAYRRGRGQPVPDLTMLTARERPIIARALDPVPHRRWPCCADLLAELTAAVTHVARRRADLVNPA